MTVAIDSSEAAVPSGEDNGDAVNPAAAETAGAAETTEATAAVEAGPAVPPVPGPAAPAAVEENFWQPEAPGAAPVAGAPGRPRDHEPAAGALERGRVGVR
ncbi:hypothetical protein ACFW9D_32515, partial [Streptomyces sp. NPDC059524]